MQKPTSLLNAEMWAAPAVVALACAIAGPCDDTVTRRPDDGITVPAQRTQSVDQTVMTDGTWGHRSAGATMTPA